MSNGDDTLVVKSRVRELAPENQFDGDFMDALSDEIEGIIDDARQRAEGNNRVTLRPVDL